MLEKLPEIVDAGGDDQQAAQAIGHRVEDPGLLNEKEIHHRDQQVDDKHDQEDFFRLWPFDDGHQEVEVEPEGGHGIHIADKNIVDPVQGHIAGARIETTIDEEEDRKIFQIRLGSGSQENGEADDKG